MSRVSIIVCTYNRANQLRHCLEALLNQREDGSFSYEIIVADNNSTDQTKAIVQTYVERTAHKVKYIFESRQGKTFALNTAINYAQGQYIAFTDDDAKPESTWLLSLMECLYKTRADGVGGRVLPIFPSKAPEWIKRNIKDLSGTFVTYDYGVMTLPLDKSMYEFLGANCAFKKSVFMDFGLFRTDLGPGQGTYGDDTEFVNRLRKAGKTLFYCGKAVVHHPVEPDRMNLIYIAQWHIGLGRFRVIIDKDNEMPKGVVYIAGIPRYLIGEILKNFLLLYITIFNIDKFLIIWKKMFEDIGKAKEIKKQRLKVVHAR